MSERSEMNVEVDRLVMHDSIYRYLNDFAYIHSFAPDKVLPDGAYLEITEECFSALCKENPRKYTERTFTGIPFIVISGEGINFSVIGA